MARSLTPLLAPLVTVLLGCSSSADARPSARTPRATSQQGGSSSPTNAEQAAAASGQQSATAPAGTATTAPSDPGAGSPSASAQPAASSAPALPELKLKLTGMHIGGGPNDTLTKRPFIQAIEAGFDSMRACYRKAEIPTKGGTFGVDLRVERDGGKPSVQAVRTVMKGDELRQCLEGAFHGLSFGKPSKGPTVLSVSVHFSLEP